MCMDLERDKEELLQVLRLQGIYDDAVLAAIQRVPRERFIPEKLQEYAYDNNPLPIGGGQTISQPFTVAFMAQLLSPLPPESQNAAKTTESEELWSSGTRFLEIGSGSGYNAAVLSELAGADGLVCSVECVPELVQTARNNLERAGYTQVRVFHGDGKSGCPDNAPFDRIMVTAEAQEIPLELVRQLKVGGILVLPLKAAMHAEMTRIEKTGEPDSFIRTEHGAFLFVPLI